MSFIRSHKRDDGEREESDNDTSPKKIGREYRDTVENINQISKSAQVSVSSTNTSPARTIRTVKKVDLGAAANYGKESKNSTLVQQSNNLSPINLQKTKNDILNDIFESQSENSVKVDDDDFNPRANTQPSIAQSQNANLDFGDFTNAFNSPTNIKTKDNSDEFADFTSAFNTIAISNLPNQPQSQTVNLMGANIPSINNLVVNNANSNNTIYANNMQTGTMTFSESVAQNSQNDLFDSLPQDFNNQVTNNNTVPLNTDLLSNLDSLNISTIKLSDGRINSADNSNILMGMRNVPASNTINYTACINEEKRVVSTNNLSSYSTANRLLEILCTMCHIKSTTDLDKIRSSIANYVEFLPGPITPQKYSGLDLDMKVDIILYGRILEEIINKFDHDWPINKDNGIKIDPLIRKLIFVDGATVSMLLESLTVLTTSLKKTNDEKKIYVIAIILENLLKSDAIFSAIIDACRNKKTRFYLQKKEIEQAWQSVTQILISLPNRVANKMRFNTLKSYTPEIYAKILCFHVSRAISFINDGLYEYGIEPKTTILAFFINKIVISFKPINNLTCFTDIFEKLCVENRKNEQCFIENILCELDSTAIEHVATLFLKRCDPKFGVRAIFGGLLTASHWKYILTIKIPLMRYYKDENLIINLISYLASFPNENANLSELLIKLLEVWSDGSILNHMVMEQHEYITQLIILSVKMCKNRLKQNEKDHCERLLFSGISTHLECTDIYLRAIGMITAEICVNSLCNMDNAPKLMFEYDNMPVKVLKLLDSLKNLDAFMPDIKSKYELSDNLTIGNVTFDSSVSKMIYELGINCDILSSFENISNAEIESNLKDMRKDNLTKENDNLMEKELKTLQLEENSYHNHSDLDSDDDLIPYNLDDDKDKTFNKARPIYLRDLRDNLTDEKTISNPDIFSESLFICEELILTQLPNDDVSFAIELLQLLVILRQHCYVENFELIVFRCCVAIVTIYPKECAEFLCKQFYMDIGRYSLSQRLLFLDILAESSKRLSKINIDNVDNTDSSLDVTIKKKPVANCVSLLINTEKCKTQEVYYNDDIDLEISKNQSIKWQEIIDKRIVSRTRRFVRNMKSPKIYTNHFGNVVSSFFYPLLHGFNYQGKIYKLKDLKIYADQENILLLRFLKTLSAIMLAAQNCPLAPKMGKEILELTWTLKNHDEATVRLAVTENIGSVLVAVPKDAIIDELSESLMEIREWLLLSLNVIYGEHNMNCRALNTKVLSLIDLIIGSTFN